MEAIDRLQFGGWDSYWYLNCKMEAEAEAEAVEAALKSAASTSLLFTLALLLLMYAKFWMTRHRLK